MSERSGQISDDTQDIAVAPRVGDGGGRTVSEPQDGAAAPVADHFRTDAHSEGVGDGGGHMRGDTRTTGAAPVAGQSSPDTQANIAALDGDGDGQVQDDIHAGGAAHIASSASGRGDRDIHAATAAPHVGDEVGHEWDDAQVTIADLVAAIRATDRLRRLLYRQKASLWLGLKALARQVTAEECGAVAEKRKLNGTELKVAQDLAAKIYAGEVEDLDAEVALSAKPLVASHMMIGPEEHALELKVKRLARQLPVYEWVKETPGFGDFGLGQIVGEAGDLGRYPNPAKLWKRMGLAVIDGKSQRRITGADALKHGYDPRRRSLMWNIGAAAIRNRSEPYRTLYDERKVYEVETATAKGLEVLPSATITQRVKKGADIKEFRSLMHVNKRSQRYMEKRMLLDLWKAWRDANSSL